VVVVVATGVPSGRTVGAASAVVLEVGVVTVVIEVGVVLEEGVVLEATGVPSGRTVGAASAVGEAGVPTAEAGVSTEETV
jgi:hypothetical protein